MLEVHSPIPLTEGESLIFGLNTKHLIHFVIGLAVSSPMLLVGMLILPHFGMPKFFAVLFGVGVGVIFAAVPFKSRPIAEYLWLSIRYGLRPKVILYDRFYRIKKHREVTEGSDID